MSILQAIFLGLIQGLTEFIPVSSSGHLLLMHNALSIETDALAFDVALHAGTLLALISFFWKDIWELLQSLYKKNEKTHLALLLILATIPAAVLGFLLEGLAESSFRSPTLVAWTMVLFGGLMLVADYLYERHRRHTSLEKVSLRQALAMGFAQAVALIPGVSRSGSTITTGLLVGLDRVAATRFSFLLGIPITTGAILKVFTENGAFSQVSDQSGVFVAGILTAFLSGLFAIRFMIGYLGKNGLSVFAYYRIGLGLTVLVFFALR